MAFEVGIGLEGKAQEPLAFAMACSRSGSAAVEVRIRSFDCPSQKTDGRSRTEAARRMLIAFYSVVEAAAKNECWALTDA